MSDETEIGPKKPRVLIVEDDMVLLRLEQAILEQDGFEVDSAAYPPTALKKLAENQYDLMITDITMPGMYGDELIRRVRDAGITIPIIIVASAHMVTRDDTVYITSGTYRSKPIDPHLFDEFLSRPFVADELVARARAVLRRHRFGKE